jgi:hypothetical protein
MKMADMYDEKSGRTLFFIAFCRFVILVNY